MSEMGQTRTCHQHSAFAVDAVFPLMDHKLWSADEMATKRIALTFVVDPVKIGGRNSPEVTTGYDAGRNGERNGNDRNFNETEHIEVRC